MLALFTFYAVPSSGKDKCVLVHYGKLSFIASISLPELD